MITIGVKWINLPNAHNVYCGRGSVFGNPYPMQNKTDIERHRVCNLYVPYFRKAANEKGSPLNLAMRNLLKLHMSGENINLQCFCPNKRCHCETIRDSLYKARQYMQSK